MSHPSPDSGPDSPGPVRPSLRTVRIASHAAIVLLVLASIGWWLTGPAGPLSGSAVARAVPIGGPFALTDSVGRPVTDQTYRGKWLLVFFGYTHCADVCPLTASAMAEALDQLGPLADRVQPLFVTVDPERDSPEVLADYFGAFDGRITGLTGTPEQVAGVARAYHVYYRRVQQGDDYTMDHSTLITVMGPDGRFVTQVTHQAGGQEIAARLRALVEQHAAS